MTRAWVRETSINNTATPDKGDVSMITLAPGQSIVHCFWSIDIWGTWGSINQFPPGSSITRAGLIVNDVLAAPLYPITNRNSSWMDLVTLHPHGQIAISSQVDWHYQWDTGLSDREVRVHRKNTGSSGTLGVWINWQTQVAADALAGYDIAGWSCTLDAYIDTP